MISSERDELRENQTENKREKDSVQGGRKAPMAERNKRRGWEGKSLERALYWRKREKKLQSGCFYSGNRTGRDGTERGLSWLSERKRSGDVEWTGGDTPWAFSETTGFFEPAVPGSALNGGRKFWLSIFNVMKFTLPFHRLALNFPSIFHLLKILK